MADIQTWVAPLAGFWLVYDNMLRASKYVNDLREVIISGKVSGTAITLAHRKTIFFDWALSMVATIVVAFIFSLLLVWIGVELLRAKSAAGGMMLVIACVPALGIGLFVLCGVSDVKLIKRVLKEEESAA